MPWEQWLQVVPLRIRSLLRARELDQELREELQFHFEQQTRRLEAEGFSAAAAQLAAAKSIGSIESCKEECRDARGLRLITETWRDLAFAARLLRKSPGFAASAIVMIALAIGAAATVFSFAHALLFQPLPYGVPAARLALIWEQFREQDLRRIPFSAAEATDLQQQLSRFDAVAFFRHTEFNLVEGGEPERLHAAAISWNLFDLLASGPLFGRTFAAEDKRDDATPSVVISESLWRRRFGSNASIIGQSITLSGRAYLVLGVMPEAFRFPLPLFDVRGPVPGSVEVWKPIPEAESSADTRSRRIYGAIARLPEATSLAVAQQDLASIAQSWQKQHPATYGNRAFALSAHSLREEVVGRARPAIVASSAAALVVLLIAIANLIALLLARASTREREFAARVALGAGTSRLFRQISTEGSLLGILGGLVGLILTAIAVTWWRNFAAPGIPLIQTAWLSREVFWCVAILTFFFCVSIGGIPAWRIARRFHARRRRKTQRIHLRDALVVAEIALAFLLLVAAGALVKSFIQLQQLPLGFNRAELITAEISLPALKYRAENSAADFFFNAVSRLKELPEISSAAFVSILPLSGINTDRSFTLMTGEVNGSVPDEELRLVTPGYFDVMEVPLLQGRDFNLDDDTAVIVNEALARKYWPRGHALGQRIKFNDSGPDALWLEVVGIAGDILDKDRTQAPRPQLYLPHSQSPAYLMTMVARTPRGMSEVAPEIRTAIQAIDPEQAVAKFRTMNEVISESVAPRRLATVIVSLYALVAVFFGAAGVYGVLENIFHARQRELAMRVAFGARPIAIVLLVFRRSGVLLVLGLLLGSLLAFLAGHLLQNLPQEIGPFDPAIFAGALVLLTAVTGLATILPARRAARAAIMPLLRCD